MPVHPAVLSADRHELWFAGLNSWVESRRDKQIMPELIVIGGAPGCGKSTLATQLRGLLHGPRMGI